MVKICKRCDKLTRLCNITVKCPVCDVEFETSELMSTNEIGSPDLDLRPPEMRRSTMYNRITECPSCGYSSYGMPEDVNDKEFIKSSKFINCEGVESISDRSKPFYRAYLISRNEGRKEEEFDNLLRCIWSCDDEGDDENAKSLRIKACELLNEILDNFEKHKNLGDKSTIWIMKSDLMRRSGQFEELIDEYKDSKFEEELLNDIIKFQIEKSKEKDTGCYTVEDVIKNDMNT